MVLRQQEEKSLTKIRVFTYLDYVTAGVILKISYKQALSELISQRFDISEVLSWSLLSEWWNNQTGAK